MRSQGAQAIGHFGAHLLDRAAGKDGLVVHSAVKNDAGTKLLLQAGHVHARTCVLNGVEHVHSAVKNLFEQRPGGAIGVVEDSQAMGMNQIAPPFQPRLQMSLPLARRHQQRYLPGDVVTDEDEVQMPRSELEESFHHFRLNGFDAVQDGFD